MEQKTLKINSKSMFCSISLDLSQGFVKNMVLFLLWTNPEL